PVGPRRVRRREWVVQLRRRAVRPQRPALPGPVAAVRPAAAAGGPARRDRPVLPGAAGEGRGAAAATVVLPDPVGPPSPGDGVAAAEPAGRDRHAGGPAGGGPPADAAPDEHAAGGAAERGEPHRPVG